MFSFFKKKRAPEPTPATDPVAAPAPAPVSAPAAPPVTPPVAPAPAPVEAPVAPVAPQSPAAPIAPAAPSVGPSVPAPSADHVPHLPISLPSRFGGHPTPPAEAAPAPVVSAPVASPSVVAPSVEPVAAPSRIITTTTPEAAPAPGLITTPEAAPTPGLITTPSATPSTTPDAASAPAIVTPPFIQPATPSPAAKAAPAAPAAYTPAALAPVPTPAPAAAPAPEPAPEPAKSSWFSRLVPGASTPASEPVAPEPVASEPVIAEPEPADAAKSSWMTRLRNGLSKTGQSITTLFIGVKVDENLFDELETALIMSDAGVEAATSLLDALRARVKKERIEDGERVKVVLRELIAAHLKPLEKTFDLSRNAPIVTMITGVNGAGKTTSIGKLARHFQQHGKPVLLAAGDTFRAAAREQLVEWGRRNNVTVIAQDGGDPAAVAFDAVQSGRARNMGVVMVDTAGRLPTQTHLMEELKKIRRVIAKADTTAPHEVLLVIDGNTGQNALQQIKAFDDAIGLTGLIVTKLDGTAKGGILAAVAAGRNGVRPIPVYWIGVGEGIDDLQPFVADEFAGALLGMTS